MEIASTVKPLDQPTAALEVNYSYDPAVFFHHCPVKQGTHHDRDEALGMVPHGAWIPFKQHLQSLQG
jgi:hypothetical protein